MAELVAGGAFPDFTLPAEPGGELHLSSLRGQTVVLVIYPKDGSKTCTEEIVQFNEKLAAFEKAGIRVLGLSPDTVTQHRRFIGAHGLKMTLVSDADHDLIASCGLWVEKSMYGKTFMGVERTTLLIGPDGTIQRVWPKVKVKGHVDEVLSAALQHS